MSTEILVSFLTPIGTLLFFVLLYMLTARLLERQAKGKTDKALIKSIILFCIALIGIISVILSLPLGEMKGQVTSLIGIVLSAVLGLSSTTFIGNALAGIALKLRKNMKPGDFITVEGIFGRITEQGLFHTEIQTIDRDLTTLPNMSLASNAVKVTRSSGTFISAEVSLGYDVNRKLIEEALIEAAKNCGLEDPFVHIISLGDFSIVYRVHGLLKDVKSIVTARSKLIGQVIDSLHAADIEIVSPNFMNQKQVGETIFIPKKYLPKTDLEQEGQAPEKHIFDKAEEAEKVEQSKERVAELQEKIKTTQKQIKEVKNVEVKEKLEKKLETTKQLKDKMIDRLDEKVEKLDNT